MNTVLCCGYDIMTIFKSDVYMCVVYMYIYLNVTDSVYVSTFTCAL